MSTSECSVKYKRNTASVNCIKVLLDCVLGKCMGNQVRGRIRRHLHAIVGVHLSVYLRLRTRGVFMVNKCILSILVYNLFLDRQRNIVYTPPIFPYTGILAVFIK